MEVSNRKAKMFLMSNRNFSLLLKCPARCGRWCQGRCPSKGKRERLLMSGHDIGGVCISHCVWNDETLVTTYIYQGWNNGSGDSLMGRWCSTANGNPSSNHHPLAASYCYHVTPPEWKHRPKASRNILWKARVVSQSYTINTLSKFEYNLAIQV